MKTQVRQPDLAKEVRPRFAGAAAGYDGLLECSISALFQEPPKKRAQPWRERDFGGAFFLTFRAQPEHVAGEIHVASVNLAEAQPRFAEPAALFPGDFIRDAHPLRFFFKRPGDEAMLVAGNFRLRMRLVPADPEPMARVRVTESRRDCLIDDEREELYFEQSGVLCGFVRAAFWMRLSTPVDEIAYLLPCELPRDGDRVFSKKRGQIMPSLPGSAQSQGAAAVTLADKPRHPRRPRFAAGSIIASATRTAGAQLVAQLDRLARFTRQSMTELRRFLAPLTRRVHVLNPPIFRIPSFVEARHEFLLNASPARTRRAA